MDFWFLLIFTLAVPLATSRTGAQSTTTSSAFNITDQTTSTTVSPIPATTTTAILVPTTTTTNTTTTVPFTTTTSSTTTVPFTTPTLTTTTDQTNATGQTTTSYDPNTATTITSDLNNTTSFPKIATTLPTASDFPNTTTTTTDLTNASDFPSTTAITTSAYPPSQPTSIYNGTTLPTQEESTTVTTVPEDTTQIPEGTNLTTVPRGTTVTTVQESTTVVTEGTTLTTVPGETTNNPSTTTGFPSDTTNDLTSGTFYPTTGRNTTMYNPNTTTTTSDPSATTLTDPPTPPTTTPLTPPTYPPTTTTTPPPTTTTAATPLTTTHTHHPPPTTTHHPPPPPTTTHPPSTTTTPTPTTTPTTTTPTPTTTPTTTTTTPSTTTTPFTHPPPTTTTPPSTTPLVCDNGGISLNGVCICPDEWTGHTCSEENFCRAQELVGFKFPQTPIGWFAYSEEICPKGTSGAGKPQASTRCSTKNGSQSFDHPPQVLQCDQTLSDLQQNLTSPADLEMLATSTQILTSKPEELTAENVTAAAQIANTLLLYPNATETVRVAAVATVSQLLNASTQYDSEENNATLGLTVTLDQLSVNLSQSLNTFQSQVVQPNLVIQSAQILAADTQGVQFTSLSGQCNETEITHFNNSTSGSFVANRIQLNTNTSTVVVENGFIAEALIYVRFPPEAVSSRQKPSNVSLGFVLYQNDRFFRSRRHRRGRATIRVLSASVKGQERSVVPQHVDMQFRPTMMNGTSLYDFACVFWDYSLEDWSTDGCSKGNASDGVLRCFCNHTTNFAALWSFREKYEYAEALDMISIVGLSFSILGLVVTLIHHIKENFQRNSRGGQNNSSSRISLLCIYISLLAFIITFISGVGNSSRQNDAPVEVNALTNSIPDSDEHVEPDRGSCSAVVALLHFFLLATFMWNSVYGTQLVLLVRTMRLSLPPYWTKVSLAVGWGVPAIVMAITLGATYRVDSPLGYRQEEFCWLAALDKAKQFNFGKPMFWGFLLPVGLILIYNIVLLVLVSLTTCSTDPNLKSSNRWTLRKKFLINFSLAVLLGLSWTLGYLVLVTTGHSHLVFSIVFCLCTTTQGFQIFILFTARKSSFRAAVSRSFQYVSSVNIQLNNTTYSLWKTSGRTTSSESYRDLKYSDKFATRTQL
ncbi:adhesion G-protein coupled receptor G7 [Enoplosus armatus]|uniref:adhesion G-protein coupled receptor G7 n=1 Tax=Enoplosus armatus TaxID=215367 RepID=UPI0039945F1E